MSEQVKGLTDEELSQLRSSHGPQCRDCIVCHLIATIESLQREVEEVGANVEQRDTQIDLADKEIVQLRDERDAAQELARVRDGLLDHKVKTILELRKQSTRMREALKAAGEKLKEAAEYNERCGRECEGENAARNRERYFGRAEAYTDAARRCEEALR